MATRAYIFERFMVAVWEDNITDREGETHYNEFQNAFQVARDLGAKTNNRVRSVYDETWYEYMFDDGSTIWIQESPNTKGIGSGLNPNPPEGSLTIVK